MDHVFATETRVVSDPKTGASVSVIIGGHWLASDPIVKAYPSLFTDDARFGLSSSIPLGDDGYPVTASKPQSSSGAVEQTTAAPGEKRSRGK